MSKKKKHLKKKPSFAPPLSKLDKWIYKIGYILIFTAAIATIFLCMLLTRKISFQDVTVIASYERATFFWVLPFFLYTMLSAFIFWLDAHETRKPIFGNPDITYGKAPWQNIYPLFSKERKKRELHPSYKKYKKEILFLWLGGLVVCICLASFGLFGRVSLMQNGDITVYGVFNNEKRIYSVRDISELEVNTGKYSTGKSGTIWRAGIVFIMNDGKTYAFSSAEFSPNVEAFEAMAQIKTLVGSEKITITGVDDLEKIIDDHNYTPEEIELLYKLFEVSSE